VRLRRILRPQLRGLFHRADYSDKELLAVTAGHLWVAGEVWVEIEIERHLIRTGVRSRRRQLMLTVRHACAELAKRGGLIFAVGNEPGSDAYAIAKQETLRRYYNEAMAYFRGSRLSAVQRARIEPTLLELQRRVEEALGRPRKPFGPIWRRPPRK
jgi:hypothetical protein